MYKVDVNGKTLQLKIGLGQLIELSEISHNDVEGRLLYLYTTLAMQNSPLYQISFTSEVRGQLSLLLGSLSLPDKLTADEWRKKALGELSMPLDAFKQLTLEELNLAYEGYMRRLELQANLIVLAIQSAKRGEPIKLIPDKDDEESSLIKREATFKKLGIKEEYP